MFFIMTQNHEKIYNIGPYWEIAYKQEGIFSNEIKHKIYLCGAYEDGVLGEYKTKGECMDVLHDLLGAMASGARAVRMPQSGEVGIKNEIY